MKKLKGLTSKRMELFYYLFFIFGAVVSIIYFNGTAHEADSITHYLFAKHAFDSPKLFLNHWAKPLFVLLASPFAQVGFVGMKIFNCLLALLNFYLIFQISKYLIYRNPHLSILFLLFFPLYFVVLFSGLTEILFSSFILLGIYYILKNNLILSAIVVSFMPFVRSEGLIFLALFGIYFALCKNWKAFFCLLIGHGIYALAGVFAFNNALWVFTHIPYANLDSPYGEGKLFHFVEQFIYVTGIPLYILFWLGIIDNIRRLVMKSYHKETKNLEVIIILGGFCCFFIAHSLFWYLGIFNSMGLKRVLVGVAPLAVLIALQGFNYITEILLCNKGLIKTIIRNGLIAYVIIFPFTSNPAAIEWEKDMNLSVSQNTALQVGDYIETQFKELPRLVYNDYYLSEAMNVTHFDINKRLDLTNEHIDEIHTGDIIVWDNWHSVVDRNVHKEDLDNNSRFELLQEFEAMDGSRKVLYAVYKVN